MQALTSINARIHDTGKMLPFEENFYNEIIKLLKHNMNQFMLEFESSKPEIAEKQSVKSIKFVEATPSFVWNNGKTYGPYNPEDIAELPLQIGEILIKERKAIENIKEG